jgi:hypothetical protein
MLVIARRVGCHSADSSSAPCLPFFRSIRASAGRPGSLKDHTLPRRIRTVDCQRAVESRKSNTDAGGAGARTSNPSLSWVPPVQSSPWRFASRAAPASFRPSARDRTARAGLGARPQVSCRLRVRQPRLGRARRRLPRTPRSRWHTRPLKPWQPRSPPRRRHCAPHAPPSADTCHGLQ